MNIRWRVILIVVLIVLGFYLLWPTLRWAFMSEIEHDLRRMEITTGAQEISLTFEQPLALERVEEVLEAAPEHDPFQVRHGQTDREIILTVRSGVPASLRAYLEETLKGYKIADWQVSTTPGGLTEFRATFDAAPEPTAIEKALEVRSPLGVIEIVPPAEGSEEVILRAPPGSIISPVDQLSPWLAGRTIVQFSSREVLSQREELRLSIKMMRLEPENRDKWKKQREERGEPVPREPSVFRNIYHMFFRNWWLGDEGKIIRLGLDLQGGVYIVAETKAKDVDPVYMKIKRRIEELGVAEAIVQRTGLNRIVVQLPGFREPETALRLITQQAHMQWMLVAENFMLLESWSPDQLRRIYEEVVAQLTAEDKDAQGRVRNFDTFDELAAERLPEETILRMYFDEDPDTGEIAEVPLLLRSSEDEPHIISGDDLSKAEPGRDRNDSPAVDFVLQSGPGSRRFAEITGRYNQRENPPGWRLAILIDDGVISAPHIQSKIEARGQITGRFTPEDVNQLVIQLRSGSLAAPIEIITKQALGPTLGSDSIRAGTRAGLIGLVLVLFFMAVYYLRAGLIANVALSLNLYFLLAAMAMLKATLTLPGIAGIILTIGMAVDANVLIYERIREELAAAKRIKPAIESGYDKAFRTILDANVTTLITAVALYVFGTGPVRGFAVTLSVGLIINMFTAIFVTRTVFEVMLKSRRFQSLRMLRLFRQPKINFLRPARLCMLGSAVLIVLGVANFGVKYDTAFGLDFKGGKELHLAFKEPVDVQEIRGLLANQMGLPEFSLRHYGAENEILISVGEEVLTDLRGKLVQFGRIEEGKQNYKVMVGPEGTTVTVRYASPVDPEKVEATLEKDLPYDAQVEAGADGRNLTLKAPAGVCFGLVDQLQALLGDDPLEVRSAQDVGPAVAATLWREALVAMIFALLGILLYVTWRFEFRFAVGAIAALVHDGLLALGFLTGMFLLGQRQLTLPVVAAILTVIGYSVNDTIVVFDRIREDLKIMKHLDLRTIINLSVNQVLSRTLLTSTTTLFAVLSLFILGGIQLNGFSFVILVGIICGTYSSIYIASPLLLLLGRKETV